MTGAAPGSTAGRGGRPCDRHDHPGHRAPPRRRALTARRLPPAASTVAVKTTEGRLPEAAGRGRRPAMLRPRLARASSMSTTAAGTGSSSSRARRSCPTSESPRFSASFATGAGSIARWAVVRVRAWFYNERGHLVGATVWESVQSTGEGAEVTGREPLPFEAYGQASEAPMSAALRFTAVECL